MGSTTGVKATTPINMPCLRGLVKPKTPFTRLASQPASDNSTQTSPSIPRALVSVLPQLCKGCELCVFACPSGNLTLSPRLNAKGYHPILFSYDGERGPCSGCGICYWVCPDMAISEIQRLKQ